MGCWCHRQLLNWLCYSTSLLALLKITCWVSWLHIIETLAYFSVQCVNVCSSMPWYDLLAVWYFHWHDFWLSDASARWFLRTSKWAELTPNSVSLLL